MFKKAIIATSIAVVLAGCGAEDRAYDTLSRSPKEITVSSLDTESLWMFMPSTGETPRYAMTQRGFFQGDPKLVTLRFDEFNGIYVEEVDRDKVNSIDDSRWDSDINKAPVLKIPGEFRQYRCAENDYDECTNREELNNDDDFDWKQATHFLPSYEDIKPLAQDTLRAWFTASNVTESADPRLVSYEYDAEAGVINVEIERTFTADPEDQYQFGNNLEDLSFKTRFFYSLVKLDKLASEDYTPVYYQGQDSGYYGFFNNEKSVKTLTGESNVQGSRFAYLNRFNPNLENIEYYLSDSYFDEGNEEYKQLTIDTIQQVNDNLDGTGVPNIKIMNPNEKAGVQTGDLRYNVFNLIADPVDNGLLGYGPSATNPLTGEIIHAHVNQYLGVILSTTRHYWEDLALRYNRQEIDKLEPESDTNTDTDSSDSGDADVAVASSGSDRFEELRKADLPNTYVPQLSDSELAVVTNDMQPDALPQADLNFSYESNHKDLAVQSFYKRKEMLRRLSEQNYYSIDNMWVSTQSKGLIKGIDYASGGFFTSAEQNELKGWDDLTQDQQEEVTLAISKHMFKSTLIHELGHNLGLRHNFMGSTDSTHFYTEDELANAEIKNGDKPAAYSSIMDYGASIFDELLAFGKYDKAALKFGYARELEINAPQQDENGDPIRDLTGAVKNQTISLAKYDQEQAKDYNAYPTGIVTHLVRNAAEEGLDTPLVGYRYCTDEHTTTNLLCNRFDEGTNLHEVTQFRIQRYKDSYDTVNRRNGRDSFYQFDQYNYFLQRWGQFQEIRDIVENVGDIDSSFAEYLGTDQANTQGLVFSEIANRCSNFFGPIPYENLSPALQPICDTHNAATAASEFFIELLNTPDMICETEEIADGVENRYRFIKLSQLWRTYRSAMSPARDVPTTCFDPELEEVLASQSNRVVIRSETKGGKIWDSLQANNPYQSSSSSVDLLGIWPDKLLAAQMMVRRDTPSVSTERSGLALMDIGGVAEDLYANITREAGLEDRRSQKITFVDRDGNDVSTVEEYKQNPQDPIEATPAYLWPMRSYFGLGGDEAFSYWTEATNQDTRVPYFAALINNLDKFSRQEQYGLSDSVALLRDNIHVNYADSRYDDTDSITFTRKGRKYIVNGRNIFGQALANASLYRPEQQERVTKMNSMGGDVTALFAPLTRAEGRSVNRLREARLIAVRDVDAINGIIGAGSSFFSSGYINDNFTRYDSDDNITLEKELTQCMRFNVDGETEEQRKARPCNSEDRLETVKSSIGNIDEDRVPALLEEAAKLANNFNATLYGGEIERIRTWNNTTYLSPYSAKPQHAVTFDYPVEEILSWIDNDYNDYRRVLEQLPVYED